MQKRVLNPQALSLPSKIANERQRTAADTEMPAIVLKVANFAQRIYDQKEAQAGC